MVFGLDRLATLPATPVEVDPQTRMEFQYVPADTSGNKKGTESSAQSEFQNEYLDRDRTHFVVD